MKSLALYIDKWYIVGAVNTDGITRPVNLPNHEDRIWLYFYEDVANDEISYGKGFQSKFRNNENHYYGDVFSLLTQSSAKYTMFKRSQPMRGIFKSSKIFDDLRKDMDEDGDITTFVSFSKDISLASRLLFLEELKEEKFDVKESVARIGHLALEYASKKSGYTEDGYYLVLNACNENLHYSLYQKTDDLFNREKEDVLIGMGTDVRSRALIEYVVDNINDREHFLKTVEERESEYLRMNQYVDDWLVRLSTAKGFIPIQLTNVTFSRDPYKDYSVSVRKVKIDERTEKIVKDIVNVIVRFVKDAEISHEQIRGILFLGNTFTNVQFKKELTSYYNLENSKMVSFKDSDLSSLVSAYTFIDCEQFSATKNVLRENAEAELKRLKTAEEEAAAMKRAREEAEAVAAGEREATEAERKFKDAMDRGYDAEREHNYNDMEEYFHIALGLRPDDEEAKQKHEESLRKKAEVAVQQNHYKEKILQAKSAYDDADYETAKFKAEEALSFMPESKEALRIKEDSQRRIKSQKDLERYLDRADLFIAQKLYKEATEELEKARLLNVDDKSVKARFDKIKELQNAFRSKIDNLVAQLNEKLNNRDFSEAIILCNELCEEDLTNKIKWTNKLAEINSLQQREKEHEEKIQTLKSEIDTAQWKDDWKTVANKCRDLLAISKDKGIKEKLAVAEEKLSVIEERVAIDKAISEIKDLIVRAEFKEAKTKLDLLSKGYVNDSIQEVADKIGNSGTGRTLGLAGAMNVVGKFISKASETLSPPSKLVNEQEIQKQIRELRKLLFAREEEFESKHTVSKTEPSKIPEKEFHGAKKGSAEKDFDDFFGDIKPKQKSAKSEVTKKPVKDVDDFFGEATKVVQKASDKIKKTTKNIDDFFKS